MTDEQRIQWLTDKANEIINRMCPLLHKEVKNHITRAVLEALKYEEGKT